MKELKETIHNYFESGKMTPSNFNCFLVNLRVGNDIEEKKYLLKMAAKYNFPLDNNVTEEERQIYNSALCLLIG